MRFLWHVKCCVRAMGHSRSAHGHHLISGLTQGLCVCLYLNESHNFPDFPHWRSIFNTCNFLWSCNYTITYKIISVTHRCTGFFIINISHITLAHFFLFLDLVRIWDDKNTYVLAASTAFALLPALSLPLTLSYSPFSSSLWFSACSLLMSLMTPPPLCLASFSFSIFSPLLFYLSSCAPSFSFTLPLIISTLLFFSPCHSSGCTKQGLGMIEALTWEFFHWGLLSSAVPQRDLSLLGFTSPSGLASQRTPHGNSLSSCLHALSSIASVPVPHTYPLVIWPNRALCLPN